MTDDAAEWGKNIVVLVKGYVGNAVEALNGRMGELESKLAQIPAGKDGADGKDGAPGADGKDAAPITAEQIAEALKSMPDVLDMAVKSYLAANPPAAGKDGRDGRDADPVSDEQIAKSVASHLALNPPAAGRDGRDGLAGVKGADGINGKDGTNGLDGLGFDDMSVEDDGDGTATLKFTRGEVVKSFPIRLPRVVDKGVFREGAFRKGDGVTWGGSFWIAQKDAPKGKPGESGDTEWRLAVKHGRAGKDGAPGRDFTPPKPVKI